MYAHILTGYTARKLQNKTFIKNFKCSFENMLLTSQVDHLLNNAELRFYFTTQNSTEFGHNKAACFS